MHATTPPIREATVDDLDEIFRVHQASVRGLCSVAYSSQHIQSWFVDRTTDIYRPVLDQGKLFVAELDQRIVGFVGALAGEVITLFVLPEVAGKGIGRALFLRGLSYAQQSFEGQVTVVATTNAVPFYKSFGFESIEEGWFVRGSEQLRYPVARMQLRPRAVLAPTGSDA